MLYCAVCRNEPFAFSETTEVMTALRGARTRLRGSLKESRASSRVGPVYHCLSAHCSLWGNALIVRSLVARIVTVTLYAMQGASHRNT